MQRIVILRLTIVPLALVGAAGFGRINATEDARQMQFALRLYF